MELTFVGDELHIGGFAGARYLKKVVFIGNVVDDADWDYGKFVPRMFENCTNLISITGCLEGYRLSSYSFRNCSSLIQLPELKVKHFWDSEFEDCKSLRNVQLHDELISMGCCTFKNCSSLEELVIPDSVQKIGKSSFEGCTHLKSIKLPCSITKIAQGLFRGCVSLSNVIIPEGVTDIESEAFMGCQKLSAIHLPESVITIGKDVFCDCGDLVIKGKVGSAAEEYAVKNNICFVAT